MTDDVSEQGGLFLVAQIDRQEDVHALFGCSLLDHEAWGVLWLNGVFGCIEMVGHECAEHLGEALEHLWVCVQVVAGIVTGKQIGRAHV